MSEGGYLAPCTNCESDISIEADRCPVCGYDPSFEGSTLLRSVALAISIGVALFGAMSVLAGIHGIVLGMRPIAIVAAILLGVFLVVMCVRYWLRLYLERRMKPTERHVIEVYLRVLGITDRRLSRS